MSIIPALAHAATLARLAADVMDGTLSSAADVARALVGIGLELVPVEELKQYLTEEARKRQDVAFEAAKLAKWPNAADDD